MENRRREKRDMKNKIERKAVKWREKERK